MTLDRGPQPHLHPTTPPRPLFDLPSLFPGIKAQDETDKDSRSGLTTHQHLGCVCKRGMAQQSSQYWRRNVRLHLSNFTYSVIDLSFAALMLGIFWIVRQARDWRISALYLCVGLLLILYPISRWFGWGLTRSIPLELDRVAVSFQRGFWLLGAFIAVAGVWSMFSSRE